jgi:hypothetical protein
MKKVFVFITVIYLINTFAQEREKAEDTGQLHYTIFSGINFNDLSAPGGSVLFQIATTMTKHFSLNLSGGYSKLFNKKNYSVNTYSVGIIEGKQYYYAENYNVNEIGYDVFPLSLGAIYTYSVAQYSPYFVLNFSYNFIADTKFYRSPSHIKIYNSLAEIPSIYQNKTADDIPTKSIGIALGIGTKLYISKKLNFDIRYSYLYGNKLENSQMILLGISI